MMYSVFSIAFAACPVSFPLRKSEGAYPKTTVKREKRGVMKQEIQKQKMRKRLPVKQEDKKENGKKHFQ